MGRYETNCRGSCALTHFTSATYASAFSSGKPSEKKDNRQSWGTGACHKPQQKAAARRATTGQRSMGWFRIMSSPKMITWPGQGNKSRARLCRAKGITSLEFAGREAGEPRQDGVHRFGACLRKSKRRETYVQEKSVATPGSARAFLSIAQTPTTTGSSADLGPPRRRGRARFFFVAAAGSIALLHRRVLLHSARSRSLSQRSARVKRHGYLH